MSKFAPGEFVRPWPPLPTFGISCSFGHHPRTICARMGRFWADHRTVGNRVGGSIPRQPRGHESPQVWKPEILDAEGVRGTMSAADAPGVRGDAPRRAARGGSRGGPEWPEAGRSGGAGMAPLMARPRAAPRARGKCVRRSSRLNVANAAVTTAPLWVRAAARPCRGRGRI
jgi:hypothetical protein